MKFIWILILIIGTSFPMRVTADTSQNLDVKSINKQLDTIQKRLSKEVVDSKNITEDLKTINLLQNEINQAKTVVTDELQNVQKRITALGEAPKDGAKEASEIATNRKTFTAEEDANKAKLAQIELINAKIGEINNLILKVRNQTLFKRILVRQTSVFQIKEFAHSILNFGTFMFDILKSPYVWYQGLDETQKQTVRKNVGYVMAVFAFVLSLAFYLSFYVRRRFGYRDCAEDPTYSQKLQSAAAMAFSFGLLPAVTLGALWVWIDETEVINGNLGKLLSLLIVYLLAFFLIRAAVRVIFVPKCGAWRIVEMPDRQAKSVSRALICSALIVLSAQFLLHFAQKIDAAEDVIFALRVLAVTAKSFSIIIVVRKYLYSPIDDTEVTALEDGSVAISNEAKFSLMITIFAGLAFIISLFGYVRLSEYVIDRFLYSVAAVGIFWLIDKAIRILIRQILRFKFWSRSFYIKPRFLVKIEFWFGILLKPAIWFAVAISILGIWGFSVDIMLHDIKNFLLGFNIGDMHVSIVSILLGIASFIVSMYIFKSLKRSIQVGQLSKMDMEEDSRNSLAAGIGLIGFIISLMIAFAVMGGSLSSIALIAGALSFGVGLGMQNIVSNFVSGIIIIFERPIKIGDWVIINGQEGIVKTINMRATLLEAFNKSDVIIPNSTILSGTLINMTYSNRIGRVEIKVGVTFTNDVKKIQETLIKIASDTPGVLTNPAPTVAFTDIAGSQLIFQLNCFTANVYNRQSIANMIREKILQDFSKDGIVLPGTPK